MIRTWPETTTMNTATLTAEVLLQPSNPRLLGACLAKQDSTDQQERKKTYFNTSCDLRWGTGKPRWVRGYCYCISGYVRNWKCIWEILQLKRNTRSAPLAVRTSYRGSDQSQLIAICALTDLTKEALPSSFLIEAFWVSTFTSGIFIWCSSLWLSRIPCSGTCVTTTQSQAQ